LLSDRGLHDRHPRQDPVASLGERHYLTRAFCRENSEPESSFPCFFVKRNRNAASPVVQHALPWGCVNNRGTCPLRQTNRPQRLGLQAGSCLLPQFTTRRAFPYEDTVAGTCVKAVDTHGENCLAATGTGLFDLRTVFHAKSPIHVGENHFTDAEGTEGGSDGCCEICENDVFP